MGIVDKLLAQGRGEEAGIEDKREPTLHWTSYRYKGASPRVGRRQRIKDVLSADKKRRKNGRQQQRVIQRITEIEAVARVRKWEAENGGIRATAFLYGRGDYTADDIVGGIPIFDVADKLGLLTEVDE